MDDPDVTARIRVSPTLDMEKWKLPDGLGRIERAIKDFRREVKGGRTLVILDPLTSFLPAKMDSNATVAVRQALDRLAAFADRNQIALVVITHINKKPDLHPLHRIVGSGQFGAATRSALIVGPEPDQPPDLEPEDRTFILTQAKTNIAKPESYRYGVTDKRLVVEGKPVTYPLLDWMDADAGVYAMALLASPSRKVAQDGREPSKSESAREWLRRTLADGPLKKSEIILAGLKETPPFGTRLLENAADAIGVSRKQLQVGGDSEWKLPATPK